MDTSNKRTFPLYNHIPQMANVTKQNNQKKNKQKKNQEFKKKEKYISCTKNIQPMLVTETSLDTAERTTQILHSYTTQKL